MEPVRGDDSGSVDSTHTVDIVVAPRTSSFLQNLRYSLPTIGSHGSRGATSDAPRKPVHEKLAGDGGNNRETAAGSARLPCGPEGGLKGSDGSSGTGGGGGGGGGSGGRKRGTTTDAGATAAVAAAAAELAATSLAATGPAAVETPEVTTTQGQADSEPSAGKQAEEHLSCKYTKEELLARHWGMNLEQMKRVKALLRMGVCEEDLEIADRLLKMGRDISNDTPLTKEEQLLGYTSQQRQRMKALQILGLTEESFERCRAVMLSSLGPSAFGYNADETAKSAARAEAEEGWTPGDKFRRRGHGQHFGGDGSSGGGLLRMPTFGYSNSQHHPHIGHLGGQGSSRRFQIGHMGNSGRAAMGPRVAQQTRRASDSDKDGYLPDVVAAKRTVRGAVSGAVAVVAMPPLETVVGSRGNSPPRISTPLSTSSDPR